MMNIYCEFIVFNLLYTMMKRKKGRGISPGLSVLNCSSKLFAKLFCLF
jgi:hypothetical protein